MRFRTVTARLALAALILAALTAAAAVAGVRLERFGYATGLMLMTPATGLGLAALVLSLAWLFSALKHNEGGDQRVGLIALIGSLLLLWPPLHALYAEFTTAPIADATTDPEDPPQFVALAKLRRPGMNSPSFDGQRHIAFQGKSGTVVYMLHEAYPTLTKPTAAFIAPSKAFWRNFETVKRMGWTLVDYNEKQGRIEAVSRSFWFDQPTDIVVRVAPAGSEGARVDLRAQSESGDRDFGRNLALLKAYFVQLSH
jgi:hypothetical protein